MRKEEEIIEKMQQCSDEMLRAFKEDKLEKSEKDEFFGYARGVRDCAYDIGVLSKTTIQENLEEILKIMINK